jgi:hypothetical protein
MYGDAAYRQHFHAPSGGVDSKGYPEAWGWVKDEVREFVGHRCIRCGHPYRVGQESFWSEPAAEASVREAAGLALFDSEPTDEPRVKRERPVHWSPCDEHCRHGGLIRRDMGEMGPDDEVLWDVHDIGAATLDLAPGMGPVQAAWRILTVHHANGNKLDLRWWNLLALCQRDHLSVQSRVVMDRPFILEHSGWFKPYAAGFYASKYLGEDITREQAEGRLDELLAFERRDRATA